MDKKYYKYCVRFTIAEYETIKKEMDANNYQSMSKYMRDRLFDRHSKYVPAMRKSSSLEVLATRVSEAAMGLAEDGRKINALTARINRRNELNKDGSPIRFGGMAKYWSEHSEAALKRLCRNLSNIKKLIYNYERNRKY